MGAAERYYAGGVGRGDKFFWGYGKNYTKDDIKTAFEACLEAGITLFDTAEVYGVGKSERILGNLIAENEVSLQRRE